jgi:hypothetical protein
VPPPAPGTPTVALDGVRYYRIEYGRHEHGIRWPLIIYRRVVPVTSVRNLGLLGFVADAAAQHQPGQQVIRPQCWLTRSVLDESPGQLNGWAGVSNYPICGYR